MDAATHDRHLAGEPRVSAHGGQHLPVDLESAECDPGIVGRPLDEVTPAREAYLVDATS